MGVRTTCRRRGARRLGGVLVSLAVVTTTLAISYPAAGALTPSIQSSIQYPVVSNLPQAIYASAPNPAASPPGMNVANCHPSAAHPRPVVLIGGTFFNMIDSWSGLGPTLANQGYCVYSTPYGGDPSFIIQGYGPTSTSLSTVAAFIDKVRTSTGSAQVDYVGWSQGAFLGELYLKFVSGATSKVANFVGIAPTTHGTTFNGLAVIAQTFPFIDVVSSLYCPGCVEQQYGMPIVNALSTGPIAQPGVKYTVIETYWEDVVTPVGSSFIVEPGVSNQWLQSLCPFSISDHVLLPYDRGVWGMVANALDPLHQVPVSC